MNGIQSYPGSDGYPSEISVFMCLRSASSIRSLMKPKNVRCSDFDCDSLLISYRRYETAPDTYAREEVLPVL